MMLNKLLVVFRSKWDQIQYSPNGRKSPRYTCWASNGVINNVKKVPEVPDGGVKILSRSQISCSYQEIGLLEGYREESCTIVQAMRSAFQIHNETVNIWTHFIASAMYLWLLLNSFFDDNIIQDIYYWPFVVYQFVSFLFTFASCIAHLFCCCSLRSLHIGYFCDYSATSIFGFSVGLIYRSYCFPVELLDTTYGRIFLPVCAFNSVLSTFMACFSRIYPSQRSVFLLKLQRIGGLMIAYVWVNFALLYQLHFCSDGWCNSAVFHYSQIFWMVSATFMYGSHWPEKWYPGYFDFIGHSHNIFHVFAVFGTRQQMNGAQLDLRYRRHIMETEVTTIVSEELSFLSSTSLCFALNTCIIMAFSVVVWKRDNTPSQQEILSKSKFS